MKKIETCWSLTALYVKVYILILVHLLVLSIKVEIKLLKEKTEMPLGLNH